MVSIGRFTLRFVLPTPYPILTWDLLLIYNFVFNLISDLKPELKETYLKDTPLRRVAEPTEVADAAIFLASNGFANNCVLNLDGGLSAS